MEMPCQFKHGCFGCCGHHFTGKKEVIEGLKKNHIEYKRTNDKVEFLKRENFIRKCGICYNIGIQENGKIGCLVYQIEGKDMRHIIDCDTKYECKTFSMFKSWDDMTQQKFKDFVENLDIDWYDFSIKMDNDEILELFLEELNEERIIELNRIRK